MMKYKSLNMQVCFLPENHIFAAENVKIAKTTLKKTASYANEI